MSNEEVKQLVKNLTNTMFEDIYNKELTKTQRNWYLSRLIHTASLELDFVLESEVEDNE